MVALTPAVTAEVLMGKATVVAPAGTVALAGTTAAALLLESATVAPPAGAGPLRVRVPVDGSPSTALAGLRTSALAAGAVTVSVAVLATVPLVAEMVTAVLAATGVVVTVNVAVVAPAAMVAEAGTDAAGLLLDSDTVSGTDVEALSVRVPVELLPPSTEVGLSVTVRALMDSVAVRLRPP
jgi:hypothetical protein